jgi:Zn-finger nucleic acid-binding protein
VFCPACRTELVREHSSAFVCPGCMGRYWQRGGEIVLSGEVEAVEMPELPRARARFRKRDD